MEEVERTGTGKDKRRRWKEQDRTKEEMERVGTGTDKIENWSGGVDKRDGNEKEKEENFLDRNYENMGDSWNNPLNDTYSSSSNENSESCHYSHNDIYNSSLSKR